MNLSRYARLLILIAAALGATQPTSARAGEFYFPVGLSYAAGIHDAVDKLEDLYKAAGYSFDEDIVIPLGLSFTPYYEFAKGFSVGADLGPTSFIVVEETSFGSTDTEFSYIIPVGAHVRYTLWPDRTVSPYVRGGFKYPIVGGPNLDSSEIGAFGAVGVEFWRNKAVGLGVEVGYDASKIKVEGPGNATKSLTFPGFNVSIRAVF